MPSTTCKGTSRLFWGAVASVAWLFLWLALGSPAHAQVAGDCTAKGIKLQGKVQVVQSFPDLKVQRVNAFPDLKVQWVKSFPDQCGKWEEVTAFPDFKIQYVNAFPDIKIQTVTSFPGVP